MTKEGKAGDNKLKVFVSYSRRDLDFADQIVAVLSWQGFLPIIDRTGIHGAEQWELRLGQLILESDIVVFVLSPDSATSDICGWEVEEAVRRGKRIVPILVRPLEGQEPHERLRDLNYIYFYAEKDIPSSGFGTGLVRFIEALSVDVEWLREHTRLEELAARWEESDRDTDLLVRGSELLASCNWRDRHPVNAPELTVLQRAFLGASEVEEAARINTESRRLAEVDAAQIERQAAIEEREEAIERELESQAARARARRIIVWGSITGAAIVVVGALAFAVQQNSNSVEQTRLKDVAQSEQIKAVRQKVEAEKHAALAQAQKATVDELIRRIRVGKTKEAGVMAMKKICNEASTVTSTLAGTHSEATYASEEERFWELYFGPMNLLEIRQRTDQYSGDSNDITSSPIESAMVLFGRSLETQRTVAGDFPHTDLQPFARAIEAQCSSYLP